MEQASNSGFLEEEEERKSDHYGSQGGAAEDQHSLQDPRKSHASHGRDGSTDNGLQTESQQHKSDTSSLAMQRKQPNLSDFPPPPIESTVQQQLEEAIVSGGFTEDELQNLRDIFDLFDKERSGRIEIKDLEAIMTSLQRDPVEARAMLIGSQGGYAER